MRPPKQSQTEFERIGGFAAYDEWIPGEITEIALRENHKTGFKDEKTGADKYADQVRFKFALKGAQYPHYSRWTTYSYGEKSNLYLKYLKHLVAGAQPDLKFDLDLLKGFKCKTMWSENGDFDNLDQIRPAAGKIGGGETEAPEPEPAGESPAGADAEIQF